MKFISRGFYDPDRVNGLAEDLIFQDYNYKKMGNIIYPVLAGITNPDSEYFCKRTESHEMLHYQYIFEYVVSGKGHIICDGKNQTVEKGDFYFINRNIPMHYYADRDDPYCKKWVNICGKFINGLCYTYNLNNTPLLILHMDAECYIDRLHKILENYDYHDSEQADLEIMHTFTELFDSIHRFRQTAQTPKKTDLFKQITEYIDNNIFHKDLSLTHLCRYFYVSDRTLNRLFAKNTDLSPNRYITVQKIEHAKELLLTSHCSIEKISDMLNFSSAKYFRKVFTAHCGISPLKWKKSNTKQ
ncbi:MAG: AraC family transcriptional regulator [Clostridia bacterium]|nr:AraC family transcriptional regulator [Clostridia bacterium]